MSGDDGRPRDWLEFQEPIAKAWRGRTHEVSHLVPIPWRRDLEKLQAELHQQGDEWAIKVVQLPVLDFQPLIRAAVREAESQHRDGPFQIVLLGIPLAYTTRTYPEYGLVRIAPDGTSEWRFVSVTGQEHEEDG